MVVIRPVVERSLCWLGPPRLARKHGRNGDPKKIRIARKLSSVTLEAECVLDVAYPNVGAIEEHANHVESILLCIPPVTINPYFS
jgi:hypothetical protein